MAGTEKSSWVREVVVSLVTAGLIGLFSLIPGGWTWLFALPGAIWAHLNRTNAMPNWSLYLLGLTALFTAGFLISSALQSREPEWKSYVEDRFLDVPWRWTYLGDSIHAPWAFCPACDTTLIYEERWGGYANEPKTIHLHCERCNLERLRYEGNKNYLTALITRQIDRNIRTGEWRKPVS